jgi:hypothetical protein
VRKRKARQQREKGERRRARRRKMRVSALVLFQSPLQSTKIFLKKRTQTPK